MTSSPETPTSETLSARDLLLAQPSLIPSYAMDVATSFVRLSSMSARGLEDDPMTQYTRAVSSHKTIREALVTLNDVIVEAPRRLDHPEPIIDAARHRASILTELEELSTRYVEACRDHLDVAKISSSLDDAAREIGANTDDLHVERIRMMKHEGNRTAFWNEAFIKRQRPKEKSTTPSDASTVTVESAAPLNLVRSMCLALNTAERKDPAIVLSCVFVLSVMIASLPETIYGESERTFELGIFFSFLTWMLAIGVSSAGRRIEERHRPTRHLLAPRRSDADDTISTDAVITIVDRVIARRGALDRHRLRHVPKHILEGLRFIEMTPMERERAAATAATKKTVAEKYAVYDEHLMLVTRAWLLELLEVIDVVYPDVHTVDDLPIAVAPMDDKTLRAFTLLIEKYAKMIVDPEKERALFAEQIEERDLAERIRAEREAKLDDVIRRYASFDSNH